MCGHCGIFNINGNAINKRSLNTMNDLIKHRGPDDEGYVLINTENGSASHAWGNDTAEEIRRETPFLLDAEDYNLGIGFRRLSILDLSAKGHQPMSDDSGEIHIVFNGEIYNYVEIRDELLRKGYSIKSNTDTEVIIYSYKEWGEKCVERFNGMWSFAIWDNRVKKLFCSRDRFGIKPFYYFESDNKFVFGSEIKSVISIISPEINKDTLFRYLFFNEVDNTNETFFADVKQLRGGCNLIIENGEIEIRKYYYLKNNIKKNRKGNFISEFRDLLTSAIKLRLRSDVEVGYALSGGVDSSSIVTTASTVSDSNNHSTFSIVYPGLNIDESFYIDRVLHKTKFNNYKYTPNSSELIKDLDDFIWYQEEPVLDLSYYNEYKLRKLTRKKNVVVSLEGQGADEIVTGYRSFVFPYLCDLLDCFKLLKLLRELRNFKDLSQISLKTFILRYLLSKLPDSLSYKIKRYYKIKNESLLKESFFNDNQKDNKNSIKIGANLNNALYNSLNYLSIPSQLIRADKSAMASSIECRFPFLDYRLVELSFSLPGKMKMNNGITKVILREAVKDRLPTEIYERMDKKGFLSPQSEWIREQKDFFSKIVYSEQFKNCGFINWKVFEEKYKKLLEGDNSESNKIWRILGVYLWIEKMINKRSIA